MGRRALPKLKPGTDVARHHFLLDDLTPPFRPEDYFSQPDRPLEIEIGSGKGLFISTASKDMPDRNFVGVELAKRYAHFASDTLARNQADNAIIISGDALEFMSEFVSSEGCHAVHVYFPDPWWKERHRKRRIMKESTIHDIQRVLSCGGELHFWTDVKRYFDSTLDLIGKISELEGPYEVQPNDPQHDLDYRTHFERRMRLHSKPVYRSLFRKPLQA